MGKIKNILQKAFGFFLFLLKNCLGVLGFFCLISQIGIWFIHDLTLMDKLGGFLIIGVGVMILTLINYFIDLVIDWLVSKPAEN